MLELRRSEERGHFDHGWLDTYHTFSFGEYRDRHQMGFRALRVLNEDRVAPGAGFPTHPHRDMEIITLVLSGQLQHEDSLGNGSIIRPGEVQRMTAGSGILHSEHNPSGDEPVHLLQIWIRPRQRDLPPGYEQRSFAPLTDNRLVLVASPDGADASVTIQQDARMYLCQLTAGSQVAHRLAEARYAWVQVARGEVQVDGQRLRAGDGAAISEAAALSIAAITDALVLLFDLS